LSLYKYSQRTGKTIDSIRRLALMIDDDDDDDDDVELMSDCCVLL